MKKTHKAVLNYLDPAEMSLGSIRNFLIRGFPDMRMGFTKWNVGLLIKSLIKKGYVKRGISKGGNFYELTEKGRKQLIKMKESEALYGE